MKVKRVCVFGAVKEAQACSSLKGGSGSGGEGRGVPLGVGSAGKGENGRVSKQEGLHTMEREWGSRKEEGDSAPLPTPLRPKPCPLPFNPLRMRVPVAILGDEPCRHTVHTKVSLAVLGHKPSPLNPLAHLPKCQSPTLDMSTSPVGQKDRQAEGVVEFSQVWQQRAIQEARNQVRELQQL